MLEPIYNTHKYTQVQFHTSYYKYNLDLTNVYCHNQFSNKQCPSFDISTFKKEDLEWQNKPKTIICPHCGNEISVVN